MYFSSWILPRSAVSTEAKTRREMLWGGDAVRNDELQTAQEEDEKAICVL